MAGSGNQQEFLGNYTLHFPRPVTSVTFTITCPGPGPFTDQGPYTDYSQGQGPYSNHGQSQGPFANYGHSQGSYTNNGHSQGPYTNYGQSQGPHTNYGQGQSSSTNYGQSRGGSYTNEYWSSPELVVFPQEPGPSTRVRSEDLPATLSQTVPEANNSNPATDEASGAASSPRQSSSLSGGGGASLVSEPEEDFREDPALPVESSTGPTQPSPASDDGARTVEPSHALTGVSLAALLLNEREAKQPSSAAKKRPPSPDIINAPKMNASLPPAKISKGDNEATRKEGPGVGAKRRSKEGVKKLAESEPIPDEDCSTFTPVPEDALPGVSAPKVKGDKGMPQWNSRKGGQSAATLLEIDTDPLTDEGISKPIVVPSSPKPSTSKNCTGGAPVPIPSGCGNSGQSKAASEKGQKSGEAKAAKQEKDDKSLTEEEVAATFHIEDSHYICKICKARIPILLRSWCQEHAKIHNGVRPFNCGSCRCSYATPEELKAHCIKIHHGREPFFLFI